MAMQTYEGPDAIYTFDDGTGSGSGFQFDWNAFSNTVGNLFSSAFNFAGQYVNAQGNVLASQNNNPVYTPQQQQPQAQQKPGDGGISSTTVIVGVVLLVLIMVVLFLAFRQTKTA